MAGDLMTLRAPGAERRSAAVRAEDSDQRDRRRFVRGLDQALDAIAKGKGKANAAKVRDDLADLAEALKPLVKLL